MIIPRGPTHPRRSGTLKRQTQPAERHPPGHACTPVMRRGLAPIAVLILTASITHGFPPAAAAQIVRDGSLGAAPAGPLTGPAFTIPAELGQTVCNPAATSCNVFHSFSEFNINPGETATFTAPVGIDPGAVNNVLTRVTGGSPSNIAGVLRSSGMPNAAFFLMNPNGVVFGPSARLDVGGSFVVATANELTLADGAVFTSDPPPGDEALLTTASPTAFGFLPPLPEGDPEVDGHPAGVDVDGSVLTVSDGAALSIVSGDISIADGSIAAPGGTVNLVSIGSHGGVALDAADPNSSINVDSFTQLGGVTITEASEVNAGGDGGGRVSVRGASFTVADSLIAAAARGDVGSRGVDIELTGDLRLIRSTIDTRSHGQGDAGGVTISADRVLLDGRGADNAVGVFTDSLAQASAGAPDLMLTLDLSHTFDADVTAVLESPDGTRVRLFSGIGGSGDDFINTTLDDRASTPITSGSAPFTGRFQPQEPFNAFIGQPADGMWTLELNDTFPAADDGVLNSWSLDIGGSVFDAVDVGQTFDGSGVVRSALPIDSPGLRVISSGQVTPGRSGGVSIHGRDVVVIESRVSSVNRSPLDGGGIDIELTGRFSLDDAVIQTRTASSGAAGSIRVAAPLIMLAGAQTPGAFIHSETSSIGAGGSIFVTADQVELNGRAEITSRTLSSGTGGDVSIEADGLSVNGAGVEGPLLHQIIDFSFLEQIIGFEPPPMRFALTASVNALTVASGDGGNVIVNADRIELSNSATIAATTLRNGDGGKIIIHTDALTARNAVPVGGQVQPHTGVFTGSLDLDASGDAGGSGDIELHAGSVELIDGGLVTTDTVGSGDGGSLTVNADRVELDGSRALVLTGLFSQNSGDIASTGDVGDMTLNITGDLIVRTAAISTTNQGSGAAGVLGVNADRLLADGLGVASVMSAITTGPSAGGEIRVAAREVQLRNNAVITSASAGPNAGDAGAVSIDADVVTIDGGSLPSLPGVPLLITGVSTQSGLGAAGDAGDIRIHADRLVAMKENATVTTSAQVNNGGRIEIVSGHEINISNSRVSAEAGGDGGAIVLQAPTHIKVIDSVVSAAAGNDGGNVMIDPVAVVVNRSQITASALGQGGQITIIADGLLISPDSQLDATGGAPSLEGTIDLVTPDIDLSGSLVTLPSSLMIHHVQLPPRCAVRFSSNTSSFTVAPLRSTVIEPGGWLPSHHLHQAVKSGEESDQQALRARTKEPNAPGN